MAAVRRLLFVEFFVVGRQVVVLLGDDAAPARDVRAAQLAIVGGYLV